MYGIIYIEVDKMKKKYVIISCTLLLAWFFLDMTGVYFKECYLVTRSYKEDGIFFLIYLVCVLLFIFSPFYAMKYLLINVSI